MDDSGQQESPILPSHNCISPASHRHEGQTLVRGQGKGRKLKEGRDQASSQSELQATEKPLMAEPSAQSKHSAQLAATGSAFFCLPARLPSLLRGSCRPAGAASCVYSTGMRSSHCVSATRTSSCWLWFSMSILICGRRYPHTPSERQHGHLDTPTKA
jgi:hypothetical protein